MKPATPSIAGPVAGQKASEGGSASKPMNKQTHPWRAFHPGWLRDKPRQVPHNEIKKP